MSDRDKGELKGTDAPGFGGRTTGNDPSGAGAEPAEAKVVADEFVGMDNDLIDMGSFGEGGTGRGTQAGGAGERLRPTGPVEDEEVDETSAGGLDYPPGVVTSRPQDKR